ncbi:MAG: DUF4974 domain-containing protein [Deltaproteobacteria bacterium]|nr:DUF4974 domain-containing protein [Deltaproteobacteria bacterium]
MKKNRYISFITLCTVLLSCSFSMQLHASPGRRADTYTFRFDNCTISEALREISQKSGVTIILKSDINKTIQGKSYTNRTLDRIINDLMRGENCAVVWNYSKGILASIGLYTFEKDSKLVSRRFIPDIPPPVREPEPEIERNIEEPPIIHDTEGVSADEEREIEVRRALMAREVMRRRDIENDSDLPPPGFPGINRPVRRVNGDEDAVPGLADDPDALNAPGTDETAEAGTGEEANAEILEIPPGMADENTLPPSPEVPDPNNFNGLEPPPMPPGF